MSYLLLAQQASSPATPASGKQTLWTDNTAVPQLKMTAPSGTSATMADNANTLEMTNKTLTTMVVKNGLTASGSTSNDFSGSTGTFKTSTGTNTMGGELDLVAGTTSIAPIKFASGTNLTAATAGAMEYDGKVIYSTPVASARGLSPSTMYSIVKTSDFTLATTSGVQSAFPTTGDVWTLGANTAYYFEGTYYITHTTTTCTVALAFAAAGGLTVTDVNYFVEAGVMAANTTVSTATAATANLTWVSQIATTVVTATSTSGWAIRFRGIISVANGGTLTPQVNWSANTTAPLMKVGSYIFFTPIGTDTNNILGNVA